jgi:hypothetical protein
MAGKALCITRSKRTSSTFRLSCVGKRTKAEPRSGEPLPVARPIQFGHCSCRADAI